VVEGKVDEVRYDLPMISWVASSPRLKQDKMKTSWRININLS